MTSPYNDFLLAANPHAWLLSADNLHGQAEALYRRYGLTKMTRRAPGETIVSDVVDRPAFLLAGFALENAIKAHLVYEYPQWVSNGSLARNLRSHSLLDLHRKSKLIPYKARFVWVLRAFEDGLDSWARYPCGLTAFQTRAPLNLPLDLWLQYRRLMRAYGHRLVALLRKGWHGPNGFYGRWTFKGEFLDMLAQQDVKIPIRE